MQKILVGVLIFVVVSCSSGGQSASSWVQSENPQHRGHFIRHPKGWIVNWSEAGVFVTNPQNPMIWCQVQTYPGSGTSQQFTHWMLRDLHSRLQGLEVVKEAQVQVYRAPNTPDIYGVKFSYQRDGVPVGSVMLTATSDGREFVTHSYAAPAQVYNREKLTLIPILASFGFQGGGPSGKTSGSLQVLRAPGGSWAYKVPPGWQAAPLGHPNDETALAPINGPNGQFVEVQSGQGSFLNFKLQLQRYGGRVPQDLNLKQQFDRSLQIPYMSAVDLYGYIVEPYLQMLRPGHTRQITSLKPISMEVAHYTVAGTFSGSRYLEEGLLKNSSMPCSGSHNDLNLFTLSQVIAPAEHFSKVRDQLWQIVSSFEVIPEFGMLALSAVLQKCAEMRRQNIQALSNMAMKNIQTNQNIMRDTVRTTIQGMEQRRQEGEAWQRVLSGHEFAVDPSTGNRYEVPVGGQYIYANPTSNQVIRSDGPISPNDLPSGFRELESAGLYR